MKHDVISKLQDLTALSWDERAVTTGTGGVFLKARASTSRGDIYYKLSNYDRYRGIFGHESANEVIASRLLDLLGIDHIPYRLVHALVRVDGVEHETWLSESRDYRRPDERRTSLDTFYDLNAAEREAPLDFCIAQGWAHEIQAMMAFDYLILNRDRHGANIEIVYRGGRPCLAPLFDHGLSFVCLCGDRQDDVRAFDAMKDDPVNNFIGARHLEENLRFLPQGFFDPLDLESHRDCIFRNLGDVLSAVHVSKIWEIIMLRWEYLAELGIVGEGDEPR